ncbi:hypothetical protein SLNSH_23170 [Alsobacter soli]|uniref:Uncharacterized protein n=1 Tax=Alsobacter soli TaxID=2109933 RepID=A0A2T1HLV0_9HYPH|nr:hypothetical protein [Alsobacter soli]PSC02608.1 hypothetical protein SLNSH_23170 [Alsobacter soli]
MSHNIEETEDPYVLVIPHREWKNKGLNAFANHDWVNERDSLYSPSSNHSNSALETDLYRLADAVSFRMPRYRARRVSP